MLQEILNYFELNSQDELEDTYYCSNIYSDGATITVYELDFKGNTYFWNSDDDNLIKEYCIEDYINKYFDNPLSWIVALDLDLPEPNSVDIDYSEPCKIFIKYSLLPGSYNIPKYSYIYDDVNREILEFENAEKAQEYIDKLEEDIYVLSHGECGRPSYYIVDYYENCMGEY